MNPGMSIFDVLYIFLFLYWPMILIVVALGMGVLWVVCRIAKRVRNK